MNVVDKNKQFIISLCEKHKVKSLFVFGSVLTKRFNKESDVDLLVDFNSDEISDYFTNYFDLKEALEEVLKRKVDLVEDKALSNPYFRRNVDSTKVLVYERTN